MSEGNYNSERYRISGTPGAVEQAKRYEESHKKKGSLRSIARRLGLAAALTAGTVGTVATVNEAEKFVTPRNTIENLQGRGAIAGIDTSSYKVQAQIEGNNAHLNIRSAASNSNDAYIDLNSISKINGMEWSNKSDPIVLKNSPIQLGINPYTGIGEDPWLVVNLEINTLLGDKIETIGFIDHGAATESFVTTLKDGKVAQPSLKSGHLIGTLDSGKVIPTERIAQARPFVPAPSETPQS